jgi:hypothetical protein
MSCLASVLRTRPPMSLSRTTVKPLNRSKGPVFGSYIFPGGSYFLRETTPGLSSIPPGSKSLTVCNPGRGRAHATVSAPLFLEATPRKFGRAHRRLDLRCPRYACSVRVSVPLFANTNPAACRSMCGCTLKPILDRMPARWTAT